MQTLRKPRAFLRGLTALRALRCHVRYLALALVATCSAWAAPQIRGTIAFIQWTGNAFEVYVVDAGSTDPLRVWRENQVIWAVSLSPDGQRVAFETGPSHWDNDLFIVNVDGSGHTQVTNFGALERPMGSSWSPDGSRLAYGSEAQLTDTTLSVATRDGGDARVLLRMPRDMV
jgi:Tol biopolymer transport system component